MAAILQMAHLNYWQIIDKKELKGKSPLSIWWIKMIRYASVIFAWQVGNIILLWTFTHPKVANLFEENVPNKVKHLAVMVFCLDGNGSLLLIFPRVRIADYLLLCISRHSRNGYIECYSLWSPYLKHVWIMFLSVCRPQRKWSRRKC